MSRRRLIGSGLIALAGVIYVAGPSDLSPTNLQPVPEPLALVKSTGAMTPTQAPAAPPPVGMKTTTAPAQAPVQQQAATPTAAPSLPRMINGPAAATQNTVARPVPVEGPRNVDLPPLKPVAKAVEPLVTPAKVGHAAGPAEGKPVTARPATQETQPVRIVRKPMPVRTAQTRAARSTRPVEALPERARPSPNRARTIASIDAAPLPRSSPAPRVQW